MTISNLLCSRCAKTNLASRERTANHTPPSWRPSWCHGWWSPTGRHIPDVWGPCPFNSCDDANVFWDWVETSQQGGSNFWVCDEILKCGHSNESYWTELSCGAAHYAVQRGFLTFSKRLHRWKRSKEWLFKRKLLRTTSLQWILLLIPRSLFLCHKYSYDTW